MDIFLFRLINNFGAGNAAVSFLEIFFASYFPYIVGIAFLYLFFLKKNLSNNREMVIVSLISSLIARFVVKEVILLFYDRARPFVALGNVRQLISTPLSEYYQSFPSGHAIFFFALSSSVFFFNRKLGTWLTLASIIIGICRIAVGVHWPSDILWGFLLGSVTSAIVYVIYIRFRPTLRGYSKLKGLY